MHKMDLSSNCVVVRHIQLHAKVYVRCSYNLVSYLIQHMDDGLHPVCCTSLRMLWVELLRGQIGTIPQTHKVYRERIWTRCVISSLDCWLLAQPHFSLGSKVVLPIMDSCLTRTKGTGLDSMVLCLLLPKASSVSHVTKISPQDNMSLQYAEAIGLHRWLGYV